VNDTDCPNVDGVPVELTVVEVSRRFTVIEAFPTLVACVASAPYEATTLIVPAVPPVSWTEQLADPALPLSVQLVLPGDTPAPVAVTLTVPVGVPAVPAEVSVTVVVQVLPWPTTTGLSQLTDVEVVRAFTAKALLVPVAAPLVAVMVTAAPVLEMVTPWGSRTPAVNAALVRGAPASVAFDVRTAVPAKSVLVLLNASRAVRRRLKATPAVWAPMAPPPLCWTAKLASAPGLTVNALLVPLLSLSFPLPVAVMVKLPVLVMATPRPDVAVAATPKVVL
jgi:hypothetical protein